MIGRPALVTVAAMLSLAVPAALAPADVVHSDTPPAWANRTSTCKLRLDRAPNFSGEAGYVGMNVGLITVVSRRSLSCAKALKSAHRHWLAGPGHDGLTWRKLHIWKSTSGSGWVGDFRGVSSRLTVEYLATH